MKVGKFEDNSTPCSECESGNPDIIDPCDMADSCQVVLYRYFKKRKVQPVKSKKKKGKKK